MTRFTTLSLAAALATALVFPADARSRGRSPANQRSSAVKQAEQGRSARVQRRGPTLRQRIRRFASRLRTRPFYRPHLRLRTHAPRRQLSTRRHVRTTRRAVKRRAVSKRPVKRRAVSKRASKRTRGNKLGKQRHRRTRLGRARLGAGATLRVVARVKPISRARFAARGRLLLARMKRADRRQAASLLRATKVHSSSAARHVVLTYMRLRARRGGRTLPISVTDMGGMVGKRGWSTRRLANLSLVLKQADAIARREKLPARQAFDKALKLNGIYKKFYSGVCTG